MTSSMFAVGQRVRVRTPGLMTPVGETGVITRIRDEAEIFVTHDNPDYSRCDTYWFDADWLELVGVVGVLGPHGSPDVSGR